VETNNEYKKKNRYKQINNNKSKGKTLVILTKEEYNRKIKNFIQNNHYVKLNKNPTQQYQKIIKQTLKQCINIIPKEYKWKYINMNPHSSKFTRYNKAT
jgi:hypothetical protein